MKRVPLIATLLVSALACPARADIVLQKNNSVTEGKALPGPADADLLFQPADPPNAPQQKIPRAGITRIILTDDHGARLGDDSAAPKWDIPPAPAAPPIAAPPKGNSYYLIPLHGEVGETFLASTLDASLADAVKRHPTVVVLDIDSPGGLVSEAEQLVTVLHRYNSKLRIVALAGQDFSAAAVATLSVREIYLKPTGAIGAATAFHMSETDMPQDIAEKMQSAWRAVARNSAEEGGHNPLLADAMIDSSRDLYIENNSAGKPVVREGFGDTMLVHSGKILTLTSHEAVACGLASGIAEDVADLGTQLKMPGWTAVAGLGTLLAADLPKRNATYDAQMKQVAADMAEHFALAKQSDPSAGMRDETVFSHPAPMMPGIPRPPILPRPAMPRRLITPGRRMLPDHTMMPARPFPMPTPTPMPVPTPQVRPGFVLGIETQWQPRSLACVVALQDVERDLKRGISLSEAFGKQGDAADLHKALDNVAELRQRIYDQRNKYPTLASHVATPEGLVPRDSPPTAPPARPTTPPARPQPAPAAPAAAPAARAPVARVPFIRVATIADAQRALASPDAHNNTSAARFLTSAPVDPTAQTEVLKALRPFLDDAGAQKAPYIAAFAHWVRKEDMPVLLASLKRPVAPPNDVADAQCWGNAFLAILHYAPDEAEKAINDHKANFFFKQNILHLLQRLIADDSVYTPTAEKLLPLLQK